MATAWYYALNGEQKGPISTEELMALVANGQLTPNDLIWRKGFTEWVRVAKVRELAVLCHAATPQASQATTQQPHPPVKAPDTAEPSEELRLAPDPEEVVKKQRLPHEVTPKMANVPTKPAPKLQPQVTQWYYARGGKKAGPVTAQFLKEKAQSGQLLPTDLLWKDGLKDWVAASTLPGLKFPAATGQAPQAAPPKAQSVVAAPIVTDEPFGTIEPFAIAEPDAFPTTNSIFDIMNDPSFAAAPAVAVEKPNAGLAAMPIYTEKPQRRKKIEFEDSAGELGYLLAAFLVPIPIAFIMAYFYGILRCYVGLYIVWYLCILGIGAVLSITTCSLFEKARYFNQPLTIGYLFFMGLIVLYTAWASTITWGINYFAEDVELERQIYLVEVMIHPQVVIQAAVEIGKELESTGRGGKTTSAIPYLILEAIFMAVAPIYVTYRRYRDES